MPASFRIDSPSEYIALHVEVTENSMVVFSIMNTRSGASAPAARTTMPPEKIDKIVKKLRAIKEFA